MIKFAENPNYKELNAADTDIDLRHIFPAARLTALRGVDDTGQRESVWDGIKLNLGTGAGTLLGAGLGAGLGYGIGEVSDMEAIDTHLLANGLGVVGGLGGSLLGRYLTFKTMAKNRKVDSSFRPRHLLEGAPVVALQGGTPEEQVEANWDNLKIDGLPSVVDSLTGYASLPITLPARLMAYKALKDPRVKTKAKTIRIEH